MDNATIALVVSQTITFLMLIISEALGVNINTPLNSILQVLGIFKITPPIHPPSVAESAIQMTPIEARKIVIMKR